MQSYQEAQERLGSRDSRKLENHTYLVRDGESLAVRLHQTNVVTYHPDGSITLSSGGWRTVTTKDRLNKYAPISIFQDRGQWFIGNWHNPQAIYQDGMTINPDGSLSGVMTMRQAKQEQALRSKVRQYAKGYVAALRKGKVSAPSGGDCCGCCMKDVKTGKTVMGNDHLREHLKEKYYVPSLAWNAMESMGASMAAKHTVAFYQGLHDQGPWPGDYIYQDIEKTIKIYLYRELGLGGLPL